MSNAQQKAKARKKRIIEDLTKQLQSAREAQADKLQKSKTHLVDQLEVAATKYLTVNGYMQARTTLDQASFGELDALDAEETSRDLARAMSNMTTELADRIRELDVMDVNEDIIDSYLDKEFINVPSTPTSVAMQLLIINLLQNVGPSIDDIVSFRAGTQEGIDKLVAELEAQETSEPAELEVIEGGTE